MSKSGIETESHLIEDHAERVKALKQKLCEETGEVVDAGSREEILAEMADVIEVFQAIMKLLEISHEDLEAARKLKEDAKGAFENFEYIEYFKVPEDHPNIGKYLNDPDAYPEIK